MKPPALYSRAWRGLDTETVKGRAVLVSTDQRTLEDPRSFEGIVCWLAAEGSKYWAWNADYDVRAICHFLPAKVKLALSYGKVKYRGWWLWYIPGKRFRASRKGVRVSIYDACQFYALSLAKASDLYLGRKKGDVSKAMLRDLTPHLADPRTRALIIEYCRLDAELCLALGQKMTLSMERIGVDAREPLSPASLAAKVFAVPTTALPAGVQEAARESYYGGRIEVWRRGYFPEGVEVWDLRSAYPAVSATLVDPGPARPVKSIGQAARYGVYRLAVRTAVPCLPYRRADGVLVYPVGEFTAWYPRPLALLAQELCESVRVLAGWEFDGKGPLLYPQTDHFYRQRKLEPDLSLAYKLLLNAWYGKLAEKRPEWVPTRRVSVDAEYFEGRFHRRVERPGRHANYVLAGEITGRTQAAVFRAAWSSPGCIAVATDAVITPVGACPLQAGEGLGSWDGPTLHSSALFLGPGVYELGEGLADLPGKSKRAEKKLRSRGLRLPEATTLAALLARSDGQTIDVPCLHADTLVECRRRGSWAGLNDLREMVKRVSVAADTRRDWDREFEDCQEVLASVIDSRPVVVLEARR